MRIDDLVEPLGKPTAKRSSEYQRQCRSDSAQFAH